MMAKGFDCASPLTAVKLQLFKVDGFTFVGRYLADAGSWKRLSPEEAQLITGHGLHIVSLFERYANRVREGARAGEFDGKLAFQYAKEVGQPEGSTIYFCVDYDAPERDYEFIEAYMRAADKQIPGYELDAYGSYAVIQMLRDRGVIRSDGGMQTYAWSGGRVVDSPRLYQYKNDATVNGHQIDWCESNGDAGGWQVGMAIKPTEPQLCAEDANKVIGFLKAAYAAIDDPEAHEECRRLANGLRRASGQEEE